MRVFQSKKCGQMVEVIADKSGVLSCCGEEMVELIPGTTDAAVEKHVPVAEVEGSKVVVKVGDVAHPMAEEHFIEWVAIETNHGVQRKALNPGQDPEVVFALAEGEEFVRSLAYCNLHGLWASK